MDQSVTTRLDNERKSVDDKECTEGITEANMGSECSSTEFIRRLIADGNQKAASDITSIQHTMLARYEKTNEMLINFNSLSESRLQTVFADLSSFSTLLKIMRVDLDRAHSRIRVLNKRISKQYPKSYEKASSEVISEDRFCPTKSNSEAS